MTAERGEGFSFRQARSSRSNANWIAFVRFLPVFVANRRFAASEHSHASGRGEQE